MSSCGAFSLRSFEPDEHSFDPVVLQLEFCGNDEGPYSDAPDRVAVLEFAFPAHSGREAIPIPRSVNRTLVSSNKGSTVWALQWLLTGPLYQQEQQRSAGFLA